MSGGVPAGAMMPYHCEVSKSLKPISATVGTSGSARDALLRAHRDGAQLAAADVRHSAGSPAEEACVRPASKSVSCGPVPR